MSAAVLQVHKLTCTRTWRGQTHAIVRQLSLSLHAGEILGLVGESGSGKSTLGLALMRLLAEPHVRIAAGRIAFAGHDLAQASEAQLRQLRGNRIAMIFQDPMTSLNPYLTIGRQLTEVWQAHAPRRQAGQAHAQAVQALQQVGLADAARRMAAYPHAFSGGMRQRVMIAMALLCAPAVLIADEPTTALDVTVQAQVLALLTQRVQQRQAAMLLISHDLAVVATYARRIAVLYAGRIVELAEAEAIYRTPRHPYTQALLRCLPRLEGPHRARLTPIPGQMPAPGTWPRGCAFAPRCSRVQAVCAEVDPLLQADSQGRTVACHNPVPHDGVA